MTNPFKPGSGLYPPYFADRTREIEIFQRKLDQTIDGTPMHMSIIGDWAMGKTSLMRRLREVAEEQKCFVSEMIASPTDSTETFVNNLSDNLADDLRRYGKDTTYKKIKVALSKIDSVGVSAFGFGSSVQRTKQDHSSPQFALRVGIRTMWEHLSKDYRAMVILIDDFDLICNDDDKLREIMLTVRNALMESIKDGVKVICVVSGTKLFEQFESIHGPLIRFFEPFVLLNLTLPEAKKAIEIPLQETDVKFSPNIVDNIVEVTQQHPYYIQEFCYVLYENAVNKRVTSIVYESTYNKIIHDLARKLWHQRVSELGDLSLNVISIISNGNSTVDDIIKIGKKYHLQSGNIRTVLTRLLGSGIILRTGRGTYEIKDKLFGTYIATLYQED